MWVTFLEGSSALSVLSLNGTQVSRQMLIVNCSEMSGIIIEICRIIIEMLFPVQEEKSLKRG